MGHVVIPALALVVAAVGFALAVGGFIREGTRHEAPTPDHHHEREEVNRP